MAAALRQILISCLLGLLFSQHAFGQASQIPNAKQQFIDQNGKPYGLGTIDMYVPNTSTRKSTWQTPTQTGQNTNPIALDAAGRAVMFGVGSYRQVLKDKNGNTIWDALTVAPPTSSSPASSGAGDFLPVGAVMAIAGFTAPTNYVLAYGQTISRTTYPDALAAITFSSAANCINGTTTISGITSTAQIRVGAPVEASCLAPGTTVATIASPTSITTSVVANVTGATTVRVFTWGNGDGSSTFNVPDLRGQVLAGPDSMGGTARNVLTSTYYGVSAAPPGALSSFPSSQLQAIAQGNLPNVAFTVSGITLNDPGHGHIADAHTGFAASVAPAGGIGYVGINNGFVVNNTTGITISNQGSAASGGSGVPLSNVQPTLTMNWVIKIQNGTLPTVGVLSLGGMTGDILCGTGLLCSGQTISASGVATIALSQNHIFVGDASNQAADVALSGDCTIVAAGAITCTKTNGVAFGAFATGTDAANLTGTVASARIAGGYAGLVGVGTLTAGATGAGFTVAAGTSTWTGVVPAAAGGAGTVTGALKANGSGLVTQAACADLLNGTASCSTDTTDASNISSGTLPVARLPAFTGGNVTSSAGSATLTIGATQVTNGMLAGSIASSKLVGTDIATVGTLTTGALGTGFTPVGLAQGGTSGTDAASARTGLGLGTLATQNANALNVTGVTALTGLPAPSVASDAANKGYVDSLAGGSRIQIAVKWATAAVLPNTPTYANGASGVGATLTAGSNTTLTVDGNVAALNDRVLVKNQASTFQNGPYSVTTVGSGAAAWVLTRVTDFDAAAEMIAGSSFLVTAGATNISTNWALAATVVTVGTDPLTFNQFTSLAGALLAANNLSDLNNPGTARTNLSLVPGINVQAFNVELAALAANATNGLWAVTGAGTTGSARTLTGTAAEVTVTNGNGVSGDPTLSLPNALTFTGKTITGGSYGGITLTGTTTFPNGTLQAGGYAQISTSDFSPQINQTYIGNTVGSGPYAILNRARAASADVQSGDTLGTFGFGGWLGGSSRFAAAITGRVNGAPSGITVPAAIDIAINSSNVATVNSSGIGVGTTTPTTFASGTIPGTVLAVANSSTTGSVAVSGFGNGNVLLSDSNAAANQKVAQLSSASGTTTLRTFTDNLLSVGFTFLSGNNSTGKLTLPTTLAFSGIPNATTPGCLSNDASATISGGASCGFPTGGVTGNLPFYTSPGVGTTTKAPEANILPFGGDASGASTSTGAAVSAYGYSKRVVLPPAPGGTTGSYKFSTNLMFPSGTELTVPCGVILTPDGGVTVRNNGVTKAGQCVIVGGSGTVYLGRDVRADWWPSTGSDDSLAINAADASTIDAASQGADGDETIIRLSCKTYTAKTAIIAHASSTNPQKIVGCGSDVTVISASGGVFARGVLTQAGQTAAGSTNLMSFTWRDFAIQCSADQAVQGITLGTTGNSIRSYTKNIVERVRVSDCRTGVGWYNTRLMRFSDFWISVKGQTTSTAAAFLLDFDDINQFNGDSDIVGGQVECADSVPSGGAGYGMRIKSELAGSNNAGIRVSGTVFYHCNKMVYGTWASTGTMGDHWFLGGIQCELCGNLADYSGNTGSKKGVMLRFDNIYLTHSGTGQAVFRLSGGNANEIVDVLISNNRVRSGGGCASCRFVTAEYGAILNITGNQLASFEGTGSNPNELISLFNFNKATISNNTVDADGIAGAVPYLVSTLAASTSNDVSVVGNNGRTAVSNAFNNASGGANVCVASNLPSGGAGGC